MVHRRERRVGRRSRRHSGRRPPTFGELAQDWLARLVRVCPENEQRHVEHLKPLHDLTERTCTKAAIETVFKRLLDSGRLGPSTVNKLRSAGKLVVDDARGNRRWLGPNPFALVRRVRERERVYVTLTLDEARRLLATLSLRRFREMFILLALGPRPGELVALRKADLDSEGILTVHRSHRRNQTKTGRVRRFLVPPSVLEVLLAAKAASSSEWLFPHEDGSPMNRHDVRRLSKRLRSALARAGVGSRWRHWCNADGCRNHFDADDSERRACDRHDGRRMRVRLLPKHLTIYDLRHTSATLLRELGCDPLVVQLVLGHTPRSTTDLFYSHLSPRYVQGELNKLASQLAGGVKKARPARPTPDAKNILGSDEDRSGLRR